MAASDNRVNLVNNNVLTLPPLTMEGETINFSIETKRSHSEVLAAISIYTTFKNMPRDELKALKSEMKTSSWNNLFNIMIKDTQQGYLMNAMGLRDIVYAQVRFFLDSHPDPWVRKTLDFAIKNPPYNPDLAPKQDYFF